MNISISTLIAFVWLSQQCSKTHCHLVVPQEFLKDEGEHHQNPRRLAKWEYSCPATPGASISVPSGGEIRIEKAGAGRLCTLTLVTNGKASVPVGRSYDGDDWERVAGPYTSLQYNCEGSHCEVMLPSKTSTNLEFQLTTFSSNLTKRDEVARFLEQATFGTTHKDLDGLTTDLGESTDLVPRFAEWVKMQIFDTDQTSHRGYYRRLVSSAYRIPGREGRQRSPCETGSRWRWYSFTKHDMRKQLQINKVGGHFILSVGGELRTKVKDLIFQGDTKFSWTSSKDYTICTVHENVFGRFGISYDGNCEVFEIGNPPVKIAGLSPTPNFIFNLDTTNDSTYISKEAPNEKIEIMIHKRSISDNSCASLPYPLSQNVYAKLSNGQVLVFEPSVKWQQNTKKSPVNDGGAEIVAATNGVAQCANAPRTFLNEDNCKLSEKVNSCAPYGSIEGTIQLNAEIILKFYELLQRPVYAVVDLRLEDDYTVQSPCTEGERSRWRKIDDCVENVKSSTSFLFSSLITNSKDDNPQLKDVYLEDEGHCHSKDIDKRKLFVKVGDQCWMSTHPDNFSVYDFKKWAERHPGNTESQNYIENPAKQGLHRLEFPSNHPLTRWTANKSELKYIGKLGDTLSIEDVPIWSLRDRKVAEAFGFYLPRPEGQNIVVCGSPGEVVNDALSVPTLSITQGIGYDVLTALEFSQQRKTVWTMITLNAEDQLRQRMAWILSQLLVISPSALIPTNTETFLAYYDIFVRNAFGSYRDVLREVVYSPMMAEMLTYYESKSSEHIWNEDGSFQYADENFAREISQLFTIGLLELNMDGTMKLDTQGNQIQSYTNDDIAEYARVWTGFTQQGPRGNVEERERGNNSIDPMKIRMNWRDHYPKMGLKGKYIGDGFPLCSDLPSDTFLRKGAKWRLLGKAKNSDDQNLLRHDENSDVAVTILGPSSVLLKKLCKSRNGKCTYPGVVNIKYNLPCVGIECSTNGIKIVQVESGVHYEFVRPPCVVFPFFNTGKRVSRSRVDSNSESMCADRNLAVAAEACCDDSMMATHSTCDYTGELVPFSVASSRCSKLGKDLCEYKSIPWTDCNLCCNYVGFFWTDADCEVVAIVDADGNVAIERPEESGLSKSYDSSTFFRVHWDNDTYPNYRNSCNNNSCEVFGLYCRCQVQVEDKRVFDDLPTRSAILSMLSVGGFNPSFSDFAQTNIVDDVTVHVADTNYPYGMRTVFEVEDNFGRTLYLKNMESVVYIAGNDFSFRNPPTFYSGVPEVRDAQYETEAAIDHYFYHENLAPFLALRFIQRFGISNPSPGFVERVATAFKTGKCDWLPNNGKYGDLGITVAAIVLDRESRNVLLDSDPSFGGLREPLLKVMALMRNFNFNQTDGELTSLDHGLQAKIGQESHEMPSVFSFFLPEYAPPGEISVSSLVSPEAMLMPYSLGLINGMISMVKYGAVQRHGGFRKGKKKGASGLKYWPTTAEDNIVDDIATLLTSGRMSETNRAIISDLYFAEKNNTKKSKALLVAQQLAIASPEFHVTGNSNTVGTLRKSLTPPTKTCKKHKVLVHLMLRGGCDSFNMLVPHSKCNGNDLNKQYRNTRGKVAIPKGDLLKIDAYTSSQQCKKFGLHPKLPFLQSLYNDRDALFFAGIGVLSSPVTKNDFMHKTKTQLFAHNTMQAEIGRLDPYGNAFGTGMLGRMSDALTSKSYSVNSFSIDANLVALQGHNLNAAKSSVNSATGFKHFNPSAPKGNITKNVLLLNGDEGEHNGLLSQFWSSSLHDSIKRNDQLYWAQRNSTLDTVFPDSKLGQQLSLVSKLVKSNECRGVDRDVFYVEMGGWDHHSKLHYFQDYKFIELNDALSSFVDELKLQKKWDDTTIVVSSDFGRTLTPNSGKGTDHGWSGHSFILGGQVNGGRILGEYPTDLTRNSPLNVGRGRLIPTMPWESKWNGVAEWLGVDNSEGLQDILPNINSFPGMLFNASDLYLDRDNEESVCEDDGEIVTCIPGDIPSVIDDDDFSSEIDSGGTRVTHGAKGSAAPTGMIISVVASLIAVAIAVFYNLRTGRLSQCISICLGRFVPKFYPIDMEDSDDDTRNMSFETDVITLLHKLNGDGVEIAKDEIQFIGADGR